MSTQICPKCKTRSLVFYNFVSQSSHQWHCPGCDSPLTFSSKKNIHGSVVVALSTAVLFLPIHFFSWPAVLILIAGFPLVIALDYLRYQVVNYVELAKELKT